MVGRHWTAGIAALVIGCSAAPAAAQDGISPSQPPAPCDDAFFSDQFGTNDPDLLQATANRAQRLWGQDAEDRLMGSSTRATCLFGGGGRDILDLLAGGGVAFGERGEDWLLGSPFGDTLDGGSGRDGFAAGAGNDKIDASDGKAELIDCGAGDDLATLDRSDLAFGCEVLVAQGRGTPSLTPRPRAAETSTVVRVTYRVPVAAPAGAYRIVLMTGARGAQCANGPVEITRFPQPGRTVRKNQVVRIGLRPPAEGWCKGVERASVLLHRPGRSRTVEPVARLQFTAARFTAAG